MKHLISLCASSILAVLGSETNAPVFKQFYDDMEDHFKKGATYNQTKFDTLTKCMSQDDDLLVES